MDDVQARDLTAIFEMPWYVHLGVLVIVVGAAWLSARLRALTLSPDASPRRAVVMDRLVWLALLLAVVGVFALLTVVVG